MDGQCTVHWKWTVSNPVSDRHQSWCTQLHSCRRCCSEVQRCICVAVCSVRDIWVTRNRHSTHILDYTSLGLCFVHLQLKKAILRPKHLPHWTSTCCHTLKLSTHGYFILEHVNESLVCYCIPLVVRMYSLVVWLWVWWPHPFAVVK